MNKKIYIQTTDNHKLFSDYFDFNDIHYTQVDLYDLGIDEFGRHDLPSELLNDHSSILIIDFIALSELASWEPSLNHLIQFLSNQNKVICHADFDALIEFNQFKKLLQHLDSKILHGLITYVLDGRLPDSHWGHKLLNANIKVQPYNNFQRSYRLHHSGSEKYSNARAFLITTILKSSAPHRLQLYKQLKEKKDLYDQGLCVFNDIKRSQWTGITPHQFDWPDGYPSMDLYKNAWLEVVPETLYKDGYFFTEKTAKPIVTKTPFLILSSMGYLDYLRSLGFKTFGNLISEKYDTEHHINNRVRLIIDQLEDIINNGAKEFYQASQDIIEYNQKHLAEITGMWAIDTDAFITQLLCEVDR